MTPLPGESPAAAPPAPQAGRPRLRRLRAFFQAGHVRPAVLAALLGALLTVAHVHTWAWPLPLLCVAGLVVLLRPAGVARAAFIGWAFGTGWLLAGVWWLYISMHVYGGLPAPLAGAAVLLLAAALSLYMAAAMAAYAHWRPRHAVGDILLFAALWMAAEWARIAIFTGFPWLASGYSQVDGPLAGLAPWIGVTGMGAALAATAACAVQAWWRRSPAAGVAALLPLVLGALGPGEHTRAAGEFAVDLVQTNIAQDEKFAAERLPQMLTQLQQTLAQTRSALVVTPETAVPLLPAQLDEMVPGYWQALQAQFAQGRRYALIGIPLGSMEEGYTNSVIGVGPGPAYRYDKVHLVPFGEFIPTGFRWFTQMMNIPLGDFNRGMPAAPSFPMVGQRLAPTICYEDLFGEELALRFHDEGAAPTALVNLSNIAWFGDTIAVDQHLHISRLRSLEFQRPMLRATNTGATALIDHTGRVTAQLPPFTRGVLTGRAQGRHGLTPYARWASRFGAWPYLWGALAVLGVAVWRRHAAAPRAGAS